MSARTAAAHTADELTFRRLDGDIAIFSAKSASRPGDRNVIAYDTLTGDYHCGCKASECGRSCWHGDHILTAWLMRSVAPFVAALSDDELLAVGVAAKARHGAPGGTRTDLLVWLQSRVEWRERERARRAPLALPAPLYHQCRGCGQDTINPALCVDCVNPLDVVNGVELLGVAA